MATIYNFSAGPATIYQEVLKETQEEFLNYKEMGYSLIEASHRGKVYIDIHEQAMQSIKDILNIGNDYEVLFLGGGATLQFAMLAYNFLSSGKTAHYYNTGAWAQKAMKSAGKIGNVEMIYDGSRNNYTTLPDAYEITLPQESAYVHITSNETIGGIQWKQFFDAGDIPLVADMSSDMLSRKFDARKFSLIYAGAQKNLGPAGVTVVVIKKSFLELAQNNHLPDYLSYTLQAAQASMLNTPPVFSIWVLGKVLRHIISLGGISSVEQYNVEKANMLYEYIDSSNGFYVSPVDARYRSHMNVVFRLPTPELEAAFVEEAKEKGLEGLKGHRSVGGCRASIYNAMRKEGVASLIDFMKHFKEKRG